MMAPVGVLRELFGKDDAVEVFGDRVSVLALEVITVELVERWELIVLWTMRDWRKSGALDVFPKN